MAEKAAEEEEAQDLRGGAGTETKDLRGGAERSQARSNCEYFDLDHSPAKADNAHSLELLQTPESPPALFAQGRTGARPRFGPASTSSNRRDAVAHGGGGVQEDVLTETSLTTSGAMGAGKTGGNTARTARSAIKVLAQKGPRVLCSGNYRVISVVHGSGARLIHCGNETRLRESNGLSQEDHHILSTPR